MDFDNTITTVDVGDLVADRFGDRRWRELDAAHQRGEVALGDLLRFMFESMRVEAGDLAAYARTVGAIRPGFWELVDAARTLGVHVAVASGGLDAYIRPILGDRARDLDIRCNRARFEDGRVAVEFPDAGRGCGRCGSCKAAHVEDLRSRGFRYIVAVGDGTSDRCMARAADRVFARAALLEVCRAEGIAVTPFEDFHDVRAVLFG